MLLCLPFASQNFFNASLQGSDVKPPVSLCKLALYALSKAITVSGVPFALVDLGAAWVYGFTTALGDLTA